MNEEEKCKLTFTKDDTLIVKGVAIILMLCNHLYPIPEWIYPENQFVSIMIGRKSLAAYIGAGAKVCVAIFAFLSGIGLFYSYHNKMSIRSGYTSTLKRLVPFYLTYWVVLTLIYLPVMSLCGLFQFNLGELVSNYLGYKTTYCKIAWYVRFYLELIITFPVYVYLYNTLKKAFGNSVGVIVAFLGIIFCASASLKLMPNNRLHFYIEEYLTYVPIVILGYYFAEQQLFTKIAFKIRRFHPFVLTIGCVGGVLFSFLARGIIKQFFGIISADIIYAPMIAVSVWIFTSLCCNRCNAMLKFLGKYSLETWFLHAIFFIGSSFVQAICYWPKVDILILIWAFIILTPISIMISRLTKKLTTLLR